MSLPLGLAGDVVVAQFAADFHPQLAEHVLAVAVRTPAPEVIAPGVLDQFAVASGEQLAADVFAQLGFDCSAFSPASVDADVNANGLVVQTDRIGVVFDQPTQAAPAAQSSPLRATRQSVTSRSASASALSIPCSAT